MFHYNKNENVTGMQEEVHALFKLYAFAVCFN